ncbi:MAG: CDP-glucose 4,6-dehydratase [Bacteroidota bacterium]
MMQQLFSGIYNGKNVLITGHTGFKGSWLSLWLKQMGANVTGYSLDNVSTPSHFQLLDLNIKTIYGDNLDKQKLETVFHESKPEIIFHLAAQSLVRDSYRNPFQTYETNVIGTLNVFEAARKCNSVKAMVNVTTDKVYENLGHEIAFKEQNKLGGYDMYSSSKACSEILTSSYRDSFLKDNSILLSSARAGNVIGGGDWAKERLIPDLIRGIEQRQQTEIRYPQSIRPWEHVLEPLSGYLLLGQKLLEGKKEFAEAWNFGPEPQDTLQVGQVIQMMQKQWDKISFKVNEEEAKNFHEAGILKLDCTKAHCKLNWKAVWNINTTITSTANWYRNYYENKKINSLNDLVSYIEDAKTKSLTWTS